MFNSMSEAAAPGPQEITPEQRDAHLALSQHFLRIVNENNQRPFEEFVEVNLESDSEYIVLELSGSGSPPYSVTKQPKLEEQPSGGNSWKVYEMQGDDIWRFKLCEDTAELARRLDDPGVPLPADEAYALIAELIAAKVDEE